MPIVFFWNIIVFLKNNDGREKTLDILTISSSALGDRKRPIQNISRFFGAVKTHLEKSKKLLIVVPALYGEARRTQKIVDTCFEDKKNKDSIIKESVFFTEKLLTEYLTAQGIKAVNIPQENWPILTDDLHCRANILDINTNIINELLSSSDCVIIAGGIGIDIKNNFTSCGLETTEITTIHLAKKLGLQHCFFYKDINGVYSANPQEITSAFHYKEIKFSQFYQFNNFANHDPLVHPQFIYEAWNSNITFSISDFEKSNQTLITNESKNNFYSLSFKYKKDQTTHVFIYGIVQSTFYNYLKNQENIEVTKKTESYLNLKISKCNNLQSILNDIHLNLIKLLY